jgi:hypothetical protein
MSYLSVLILVIRRYRYPFTLFLAVSDGFCEQTFKTCIRLLASRVCSAIHHVDKALIEQGWLARQVGFMGRDGAQNIRHNLWVFLSDIVLLT